MKDALIILGMIVAAVAIGTLLFFFGPATFRASVGLDKNHEIAFRTLREGDTSEMNERTNYRIQTPEQLSELWGYLHLTPGSAPSVDFTKNEVLALFDGTHTTNGYYIQAESFTRQNDVRVLRVVRIAPGATCNTVSSVTSPYQVIVVPKSDLPLTHEDETIVQECP